MKKLTKKLSILNAYINFSISKVSNFRDIKDKLRLGICLTTSDWANILYNRTEMYEKFDIILKEVDKEYRTTLINFVKYKLVMFTMAKIMEMERTERNKVALYLYNIIK